MSAVNQRLAQIALLARYRSSTPESAESDLGPDRYRHMGVSCSGDAMTVELMPY
ncbi:hypothetical protein [Candidatus Poriferisodalis sp.]|uniref:hypothetical protein n=1 Tax=Candidatus Poriferisodalis sp. TaxID=3101277 RepID=UPI003B5A4824